jgi:hypothetical protein
MNEAIKKFLEALMGALGGWLAGLFISIWTAGPIQSLFDYQTGWYLAYAPYLLFPFFVFFAYIYLLNGKWLVGFLLIAVVLAIFIWSHQTISLDSPYRFVEFVALWTFVAQFAAILTLGAWRIGWDRYECLRKNP